MNIIDKSQIIKRIENSEITHDEACSSYDFSTGKCLENDKYCDYCYSEYNNCQM